MSKINDAVANLTNEFMLVVEPVYKTHTCHQLMHGMEELATA
jgi:hypothetical protein